MVSSVLINDSKAAFIFALLLKIMTINVKETTILTIKAVIRKLIGITYVTVLVSELHMLTVTIESEVCVLRFSAGCWLSLGVLISPFARKMILTGSLILPIIFPQAMVCAARIHVLLLIDTSIHVTLVWLVIEGQLPQFDARMLLMDSLTVRSNWTPAESQLS